MFFLKNTKNSIIIIFTLRAFERLPMSLCFHKNCENSKYIIKKKPTCNPQKRGTCTCSTFSSTYSVYEYQFFEYESIECVLGSQRARIPSQESGKPSQESGKPSQNPGIRARNPIIWANGPGFRVKGSRSDVKESGPQSRSHGLEVKTRGLQAKTHGF